MQEDTLPKIKDILELTILYPEVKIPYKDEADYYLNQLISGGIVTKEFLEKFIEYENTIDDIRKYKNDYHKELLGYLNSFSINDIEIDSSTDYMTNEFGDFKPDKVYLSVNLKEANWTAFREILYSSERYDGLEFKGWQELLRCFKINPVLANSKTFTQYLFDNINFERLVKMERKIMTSLLEIIDEQYNKNIVAKRDDEILFEFNNKEIDYFRNNFWYPNYRLLNKYKMDIFKISEHISFGEFVRIKENLITGRKKLYQVPDNKYFMHFKNLILKKKVEERDLYFMVDKHLAIFVVSENYLNKEIEELV